MHICVSVTSIEVGLHHIRKDSKWCIWCGKASEFVQRIGEHKIQARTAERHNQVAGIVYMSIVCGLDPPKTRW